MNWKKPLWMLLTAILILSITMISVDAPQSPKLYVDPPTYTATQLGEVFTIDIDIANVQDLWGFELKLGYNTTLLDVLSASENRWYAPIAAWKTEVHEPEGYVLFEVNFTGAGEGNGTLAWITFEAAYAESVSCTLDLYDTKLFDSGGGLVAHEVEDGNYEFLALSITIATDQPTYLRGENVQIHGNLTLGGSPHEGLAALEVDNPGGFGIVRRTLQIGPTPPPGNITIIDVVPCDMWGTPKDPPNFSKGTKAYFNVTIRNSGTESENVAITANGYDGNMVPLAAPSLYIAIGPGTYISVLHEINIPDWAYIGAGTVYVSVFTGLPRNGGVPFCPEETVNFTITDGGGGAAAPETQSPGNYTLTFKLGPLAGGGIYRVYASACYLEKQYVMDSTVFGVDAICVPNDYPTIQEAINAATLAYDTIIVLAGTYNENIFVNKTLTLFAREPSKTRINGTGTGNVVTVTANNVEISGFTIQNGGLSPGSGIALIDSSGSTISENTITSNKGYGICLNHSTSITLKDNKMVCNKYNFGVFGDSVLDFTHDIDTSNTVDEKPVIYWVNKQNSEVPSNAGFVAIVSSTNIAVRGLDLRKEGQGVLLAFTTYSLIERVKIINNEYGIYQVQSDRNTIVVSSVSNNTVGIYQDYCNDNVIARNNFTYNTNQVEIYQPSNNTWNDGTGKGNYWSDYVGEDLDVDGVGDTLLPHQGVDWFPLMSPYVLMHDIAITNVTFVLPCDESHLYPGWIIDVTATVKNEGDFTENSFNIVAYYGGNPIEMKTVSELIPLAETAIDFAWDTEGVSPGNHTISAEAIAVQGETETMDNTYIDGNVTLLVPTLHDVAVTSVTPAIPYNASYVYAGRVVSVTVTVKNEGHYRETLNVTAYYGNATIEMETITLFPVTNTTLTLTWDTTEVPTCRDYTISANATIPVGDDPGDNLLVDGNVYVRILGDVSGDGLVDGLDQIMIGIALQTEPGDQLWNPAADVSVDGLVDGLDQIIVGIALQTEC